MRLVEPFRMANMTHLLRLYSESLEAGALASLPAIDRVIYLASGSAVVRSEGQASSLEANSTWCGSTASSITAGKTGARLLCWELVRAGVASRATPTLEAGITLDAATGYLMRCDRVDFPLGGEALTHVHQGPGIRSLLSGQIRIDTAGHSTHINPGGAWFEAGPDPVYAAASRETPTGFARVMILPRSCQGKSSIRYVRLDDADKPKSQKYQIFADECIEP